MSDKKSSAGGFTIGEQSTAWASTVVVCDWANTRVEQEVLRDITWQFEHLRNLVGVPLSVRVSKRFVDSDEWHDCTEVQPDAQPTPKWQEGTWTLTAPDGRTWQSDSPLRVVSMEMHERVPVPIALARIKAFCEEADAQPTPSKDDTEMAIALDEIQKWFNEGYGPTKAEIYIGHQFLRMKRALAAKDAELAATESARDVWQRQYEERDAELAAANGRLDIEFSLRLAETEKREQAERTIEECHQLIDDRNMGPSRAVSMDSGKTWKPHTLQYRMGILLDVNKAACDAEGILESHEELERDRNRLRAQLAGVVKQNKEGLRRILNVTDSDNSDDDRQTMLDKARLISSRLYRGQPLPDNWYGEPLADPAAPKAEHEEGPKHYAGMKHVIQCSPPYCSRQLNGVSRCERGKECWAPDAAPICGRCGRLACTENDGHVCVITTKDGRWDRRDASPQPDEKAELEQHCEALSSALHWHERESGQSESAVLGAWRKFKQERK